ncbi:hypothetical protein C8R47DRAFT_988725 [Mycena vitilis]|nr:hypothetical protein C8R47DRAFT_988725 [Mycena vitilis]
MEISPSATEKPEELCIPLLGTTEVTLPSYAVEELRDLPRVVIMKDSWPLASRSDNEGALFRAAKGYFGLPDVRATFEVYHKKKGDHTFPTLETPTEVWDVYHDNKEGGKPERRTHKRSIATTVGTPLRQAASPKDLLEALLHAIIGYLNLLQKEWQHRDVSNGNVLLALAKDNPASQFRFYLQHINSCRGILTDGDQAVQWKQDREPASHHSGTLPFMSFSLLENFSQPEAHLHTGLDDLESFIWIFVWEVLHQGHKRRLLSPMDKEDLQSLMSTDPAVLARAKRSVLTAFEQDTDMFEDSYLSPYIKLLNEWSVLSTDARPAMRLLMSGYRKRADGDEGGIADDLKKIEDLCFKTGHKYLEIGFKHLNELPGFWPVEPAT